MAQISIPIANKVGQSMFWNSMWDSKINYSRPLKEDIFIREFIPAIFGDSVSSRVFKSVKYDSFNFNEISFKYNHSVRMSEMNRKDFYSFLKSVSKINLYKTKVWIFKYQKWAIIYFFIYLPRFNIFRKKFSKKKTKDNKNNTLGNLFSLYKIVSIKTKFSYKFLKKNNFNRFYF